MDTAASLQTTDVDKVRGLIHDEIKARVDSGTLNANDLFAVTALLMELAQRFRLGGPDKKDVVMAVFLDITGGGGTTAASSSSSSSSEEKQRASTFREEVLPALIDMVKLAARGGLQLAIETRCCGLIRA